MLAVEAALKYPKNSKHSVKKVKLGMPLNYALRDIVLTILYGPPFVYMLGIRMSYTVLVSQAEASSSTTHSVPRNSLSSMPSLLRRFGKVCLPVDIDVSVRFGEKESALRRLSIIRVLNTE